MIGSDYCDLEPMASQDLAFLETCIEYKIAATRSDREAAFRLLYRAIRAKVSSSLVRKI